MLYGSRQDVPTISRHDYQGKGLAGNRIVGTTTLKPSQMKPITKVCGPKCATEQLDRVATLQMYIAPRMPTLETGQPNRHSYGSLGWHNHLEVHRNLRVTAPCAPHVDDAVFLRI